MGFGSLTIYSGGGGGSGADGGASFYAANTNSVNLNYSSPGGTLTATLNLGATGVATGWAGVSLLIVDGSTPGLVGFVNDSSYASAVGPFSYTSFAQGLTLNGHTLQLGAADTVNPGGVGVTTQSFIGAKSFISNTSFGSTVTTGAIVNAEGASGLPPNTGTSTGFNIFRLSNSTGAQSGPVLDHGIAGLTGGAWLQSRSGADNTANYPLLLNPNGGFVGIGTTNPLRQLTLGFTNTSTPTVLAFYNTSITDDSGLSISSRSDAIGTTTLFKESAAIVMKTSLHQGSSFAGTIGFYTAIAGNSTAKRMEIAENGFVSLASGATPVARLTISDGGTGFPITAAQGLQFGVDASANMYRGATGVIKMDGALAVGSTASVAISEMVPIVIGGTTTTSTLTLRSTSGVGAAGADIIFTTGNNGATEAARIINSGFVGIATTTPGGFINPQATQGQAQTTGSTTNLNAMRITNSTDGQTASVWDFGHAGITFGAWMQARSGNTYAVSMPILINPNGGNVGIGTGATLPDTILEITDASPRIHLFSTNSTGSASVYFDNNGGGGTRTVWLMGSHQSDGNKFKLINNSNSFSATPTICATATTVGINTATPAVAFDINASTAVQQLLSTTVTSNAQSQYKNEVGNTGTLYVGKEKSSGGAMISGSLAYAGIVGLVGSTAPLQFATNNAVVMTLLNGGNVGIGTDAPSAQLHTTGTVRLANFGAGTATFDASGNVSSVSDCSFKTNIEDYAAGLTHIIQLRPVQYNFNEESGLDRQNKYVGFIAQEVEDVLPHSVYENIHGVKSLSDRTIIAALVRAIKDLETRVSELEG